VEATAPRELEEFPEEVDELEEYRPRSAWRQLLDTIRGDLYSMLVLSAAVVIGILLILLLLLKG